MLSRRMRLDRAQFRPGAREYRLSGRYFSVSASPATGSAAGMAAIVSKKVARLSVRRHRLKRRMLHVMRPRYADRARVIAVAKPGSADIPFSELSRELDRLVADCLAEAERRGVR